jgi:hypothetical protein
VTEAWRTLQQSYREVDKLYEDIYPPVFSRQDWEGSVFAHRTLGDKSPVEVWYLAEHFLLAWSDWWGLCDRYLSYFGQPENKLPRTWWKLKTRCRSLIDQIFQDRRLEQIVCRSWMQPHPRRLLGDYKGSSRTIYHAMVANHRRLQLFKTLGFWGDGVMGEFPGGGPEGEFPGGGPERGVWFEAHHLAQRINGGLLHEWDSLPGDIQGDARWHMRNYQRANLLASWLMTSSDHDDQHFHSALWNALRRERSVIPTIKHFLEQLSLDHEDRDIVGQVLQRTQAAIADFGYDAFIDDVMSGEFIGGDESPTGSSAINLIPSERKGNCCTTLLAVSKGDKKALGFPAIMKQVREHLIRCTDKTRVVIFLCDHWFPGILDDHIGDLQAHYDRGVRMLYLMAGTPGRSFAPVAVDLGVRP